jgi:hypothetical protein
MTITETLQKIANKDDNSISSFVAKEALSHSEPKSFMVNLLKK